MNQTTTLYRVFALLLLLCVCACTGDIKTTDEKIWPPLPGYTVHRRNPFFRGGQQGHVIVPTGKELSRDSLILVLKLITEKENFTLCRFYTNTDAYRANVSALFNSTNPGVLENDFLGLVDEGEHSNLFE